MITETAPGGAGAAAGLASGHLLEAWERRGPGGEVSASGDFRDALDLWQVEVEQRPRGGVRVRVESPGTDGPAGSWVELPTADWGIDAESADNRASAVTCDAGAPPDSADNARLAAVRAEAAQRAGAAGDDEAAECFWRGALAAAGRMPASKRAHLEDRYARFLLDRDRYEDALAHHESALRLRRSVDPTSLAVASSLDQAGIAAWYRGDRERVRKSWQEALAIREVQVPGSLLVAKSLNNLSLVSPREERLALLRRALTIRERLDPESVTTANLLTNVSNYYQRAGDDVAAEPYLKRAEAMLRRIAPERRQLAVALLALGSIDERRGRLAEAEASIRDAVALLERVAPQSFDLADAWLQLGDLLLTRWDSERGEVYLRRALELFELIAPESPMVVPLLLNLGLAAKHRGEPGLARSRYREAIARGTGRDADEVRGVNVAIAINNLGSLAEQLGELEEAERRYEEARAVFARQQPEGPDAARTLTNLGQLRLRRGDLKGAERILHQALRTQDRLAPGSVEQAKSLAGLAQIALRRGAPAAAEQRFRLALEALEADRFLSAGSDLARSRANEDTASVLHAFVAFLIDQGREAEAFALTERARARSFRAMLAAQDLRLPHLPPALEAERRRLQAAYDRTLLTLGTGTSGPGSPTPEDLRAELERLREDLLALTAGIARSAPQLGALTSYDDAGIAAIRAALPAGTVVLSYLVGTERSFLFLATAAGVRAVPMPFGVRSLEREVDDFLQAIARRETLHRPRYRRAAERLSAHLLGPAAEALASAESVIVIPHGPLHRLPFAALPDPADPRRYWVEAIPLTLAPSLVALAEIQARPRSRKPVRMAAFGVADPRGRRADGTVLAAVRGSVRAGLDLAPLAHVRPEVEAVGRLFGASASTYLDGDATEERVKSLDGSTRLVHLATHAWVDDRFPLESGLVLSIPEAIEPGRDNGVLQAWEILEQMDLDADLVTLSGCRTGLGRSFSGEGMLGLTRAFHVAGARAVLASLWQVSDASTGTLMARFYHHVRQGRSIGEALRTAQLDLLTTGSSGDLEIARPFHWAGFQLFGDGSSTWKTTP
ncbi:MAG: CHAT domain-containing protein [Holophagales bacterium]|nr:CHAT domain-containing protein [Holophagales bacterium]